MKGKFEMSFKKKRNQLIRYAIQNTTLIVAIHGQDVYNHLPSGCGYIERKYFVVHLQLK